MAPDRTTVLRLLAVWYAPLSIVRSLYPAAALPGRLAAEIPILWRDLWAAGGACGVFGWTLVVAAAHLPSPTRAWGPMRRGLVVCGAMLACLGDGLLAAREAQVVVGWWQQVRWVRTVLLETGQLAPAVLLVIAAARAGRAPTASAAPARWALLVALLAVTHATFALVDGRLAHVAAAVTTQGPAAGRALIGLTAQLVGFGAIAVAATLAWSGAPPRTRGLALLGAGLAAAGAILIPARIESSERATLLLTWGRFAEPLRLLVVPALLAAHLVRRHPSPDADAGSACPPPAPLP